MNTNRLLAAALFLAATVFLVPAAYAQQRPAAPAAGGNATASVPDSKIAFIDTTAFGDDKNGIVRFNNAMRGLEREFQPQKTEIENLQKQYQGLVEDVRKLTAASNVVAAQQITQKQEQATALQTTIKRKQEDAEASFQKRYETVMGPITSDIGKALDAFAKQRGITMILDVSKLAQIGAVLTATDGMDVTRAFITEYNATHPATASAAGPER